jgi:hypothetical protein
MVYIGSTRFNNDSYNENMNYRLKHKETVIYGTSVRIQEKYPLTELIFVIEMNNEKNQIEGIGLIRNSVIHDRRHRIYANSDYNRYIYRGTHWLSRERIQELDKEILEICDLVLFKGKSHLKRQAGISVLTNTLFTNWDYNLKTLTSKIKNIFLYEFKEVEREVEGEKEGEVFEIIPKKRKRDT